MKLAIAIFNALYYCFFFVDFIFHFYYFSGFVIAIFQRLIYFTYFSQIIRFNVTKCSGVGQTGMQYFDWHAHLSV